MRSNRDRRGNSLIEFALVGMVLVPLFLGTTNIGLNLGRSVQVQQLARDAGHMYVRQVDFSRPGNRKLLVRLGQNLGLQETGGKGVVILSMIQFIGDAQCAAAGLAGACPNKGQAVFLNRIVIGDSALKPSEFGTPNPALVNAQGNLQPTDYLVDPTAVTVNFSPGALKDMIDGEVAFLTEAYFEFPEWFLNQSYTRKGVYSRSIF